MSSKRLIMMTQVGPYPVDIYEVDRIDEDDSDGEIDTSCKPMEVRVNARCQGAERWAVIFHELGHLAFSVFHVKVPDDIEETACEAIAITFAEALRSMLPEPPRSISATDKDVSDIDDPQ